MQAQPDKTPAQTKISFIYSVSRIKLKPRYKIPFLTRLFYTKVINAQHPF